MCLIVVQPKDASPMSQDEFSRVWKSNKDGGGLMYPRKGQLVIRKPFWTEHRFWRGYRKALAETDGHIVLHFRLASQGRVSAENTHPFIVSNERCVGFVHNGNLDYTQGDTDWSDTRTWATCVFGKLPASRLFSRDYVKELEIDRQVNWSKLVFLSHDDRISIVREWSGYWDHGRWYSNSSHRLWNRPITYVPSSSTIINGFSSKGREWDYGREWDWNSDLGDCSYGSGVPEKDRAEIESAQRACEEALKRKSGVRKWWRPFER